MAKNLSAKIGEMEFDGLITGIYPPPSVSGGVIAKASGEAVTYKRGTVLGFKAGEEDGKLYIMADGDEITPSCILCDDIEVDTKDDVTVPVYIAGCFDPEKVITKDEYALKAADLDNLRMRGIVLKAASAAV